MASQPTVLPWYASFLCAGLGACTAELATLPIDTAKVRLQLLNRAAAAASATAAEAAAAAAAPVVAPTMLQVLRGIARDEGLPALYKGLWPALHRQLLFASLRVGLYGQISAFFRKPGETTVSLGTKIASGLAAGAIGITIATVRARFSLSSCAAASQAARVQGCGLTPRGVTPKMQRAFTRASPPPPSPTAAHGSRQGALPE